jgi:hypothetical protein
MDWLPPNFRRPKIERRLTAAFERTQAQAIKANVICYLMKPFAADHLLACVRCALERHVWAASSCGTKSCSQVRPHP